MTSKGAEHTASVKHASNRPSSDGLSESESVAPAGAHGNSLRTIELARPCEVQPFSSSVSQYFEGSSDRFAAT